MYNNLAGPYIPHSRLIDVLPVLLSDVYLAVRRRMYCSTRLSHLTSSGTSGSTPMLTMAHNGYGEVDLSIAVTRPIFDIARFFILDSN